MRPLAEARRRYVQMRDNYVLVFVLILFVIALISVVPSTGPGALVSTAVQSLALLLTLRNAGVQGRSLNLARGLALCPILAVLIGVLLQQSVGPLYYVSMTALIVATQTAIIAHAIRRGTITADTVVGALCVYLLLGLLFSTLDAFFAHSVAPYFAQAGPHPPTDYVYFSFITLATVGYGDLTPGPPLARILAVAEGLLGQLYLVTVISLLVGNLGAQRLKGPPKAPGAGSAPSGPSEWRV